MVERYIINYDSRGEQPHPSGDFVHYSDYSELAAENERLKQESAEWEVIARAKSEEALTHRREMDEILRKQSERDIPFAPATRPSEQAVTEAQVEAVAHHVTNWLGYSWEGLGEGSVVAKGFRVFTHGQFGWGFQGRQDDMRALAKDLLTAAQEEG